MKLTSFEELDCWKACRIVRNEVKLTIKKFPPEEKYALSDNMRRSSRSITDNIVEGFGRFHFQENIQFCRISRGSLFELIDQHITALDESYITKDEYNDTRELLNKAIGLLNGYINYLEKSKAKYKQSNINK
ncbi:MAG: four helix bundle protein [Bacteroidetes bacterium]|nr:four helix bundle protein [Bacteroidota bacterium]